MLPLREHPSTEYVLKTAYKMASRLEFVICLFYSIILLTEAHGPVKERDNEDIAMGRKVPFAFQNHSIPIKNDDGIGLTGRKCKRMGAKWCSMAKVCNHDRVPICGLSHAGDIMGFRDLCDMFDFNCIRRRNYKQTTCPEDRSVLTVSRRPTNSYFDD